MNELFKISMTADVSGYVAGMAKAESATERFGLSVGEIVKVGHATGQVYQNVLGTVEQSLKHIRNVGIAGTVSATGWGIAAASFETKMRNVNAILHGTEDQFNSLSGKTLDLSAQYPQSIGDTADALYQIVSANYSGAASTTLLSQSLKTASAGLTDTETAGNALIFALKAYGLEASQASGVSDILFQTVNKGIITFPQLAAGMGEWVGMAAAAKVPLDQASSALAAMTLAAIDPSEAATSLARMMQSFIKPSKDMTAEVHKLGFETPLTMLKVLGLRGSIQALAKSTGGSVTAFTHIFQEIRAARGAFALVANDGKNYADTAAAIESQSARAGATQAAFGEQSKAAGFKFHVMLNELQRGAILLGTPLLVPAKAFFDIIGFGAKALGSIPGPILAVIGVGTALVGVFTTLAAAVGLFYARRLLMTGVFSALSKGMAYLSVNAANLGIMGPKMAAFFGAGSVAAERAGSSLYKFAFGLAQITRIPFISSISGIGPVLSKIGITAEVLDKGFRALKVTMIGLAGIGVAALAGVFIWNSISASLRRADQEAKQFWNDWNSGFKVENFTEFNGFLDSTSHKLDQERKKFEDRNSGWSGVGSYLSGVKDILSLQVPGFWSDNKKIDEGINNMQRIRDTAKQISELGQTVGRDVFANLWSQGIELPKIPTYTPEQIQAFALENNIQLFDPTTKELDKEALKQVTAGLVEYTKTWGKLPGAARRALGDVDAAMKASADYMKNYVEGVGKNFLSGFDAVDKFNNQFFEEVNKSGDWKGFKKNSFSLKGLSDFYGEALTRTSTFMEDFRKGVEQGIDPNFLGRILAAGPNAAGDLLHAITSDAQGQFTDLINNSEKLLTALSMTAIRQAKLVAIATQPGQGWQVTEHLPAAQKIQAVLEAVPKISLHDLAAMTGLTMDQVRKVGEEYAIHIPVTVEKVGDSSGAMQNNMDAWQRYIVKAFPGIKPGPNGKGLLVISAEIQANLRTGHTLGNMEGINQTIANAEKGRSPFVGFNLNHELTFDKKDFEDRLSNVVRSIDPTAPQNVIHLLAQLDFKRQAGELLQTAGATQPQIDTVVNLIGTENAGQKLRSWQNELQLTPQQLYTAFSVLNDQKGQDDVLNWIAEVEHVNVQTITVQFDEDHLAHFYRNATDAKNHVHEINVANVRPTVDMKTDKFTGQAKAAKTKLGELKAAKANPTVSIHDAQFNAKYGAILGKLRNLGKISVSPTVGPPTGNPPGIPDVPTIPGTNIMAPENGGIVRFADGGSMRRKTKRDPEHIAEVAPAGAWRVWAEPETGGEAYIPLAHAKKKRSTKILEWVADKFGYSLAPKKVHHFASGGYLPATSIIQRVKNMDWEVANAGATQAGTPSFAATIAKAKADNPATDANSQQQQNQAVTDAINAMAKQYVDVAKAAGPQAASSLVQSGLTGPSFDDAAQKIIEEATGRAQNQRNLAEAKHTVGDMSDAKYAQYLHGQLATTKKYGTEWMDAWQKLQDLQKKRMEDHKTLLQNKFDAGLMSSSAYENVLKHRLSAEKRYSAEWFETYNQIKSLKSQDRSIRASIEDAQYQMGMMSANDYLKKLNERQHLLKKNTAEWWQLKQQMDDLKQTFSSPYKEATNITSKMGGQVVHGFDEVKNFYTHTLAQSTQYINTLQKLKDAGLNKTVLQQLQAAGPQDLSLATSILSGGASGIGFVNDAQKAIDQLTAKATAQGLGANVTNTNTITMGGVSIKIGDGVGLTEQQVERALEKAFAKLGSSISIDLEMGVSS